MSNNIAIIPVRGGSKRIPRKNIIDFDGKPMIAWTVEAAIESKLYSKVLVSTDCEEIARISKKYGADVPFLRRGFSDDITPVSEATCDALTQSEIYWGQKFDTITQLMANCPLRKAEDIIRFHNEFKVRDTSFLLSCFKFGWMNPWWAHKKVKNKYVSIFPKALKKRSQDLNDLYCPTGAIWISDIEILLKYKTFYNPFHTFFPLSIKASIDIDDKDDLMMARSYFHIK